MCIFCDEGYVPVEKEDWTIGYVRCQICNTEVTEAS